MPSSAARTEGGNVLGRTRQGLVDVVAVRTTRSSSPRVSESTAVTASTSRSSLGATLTLNVSRLVASTTSERSSTDPRTAGISTFVLCWRAASALPDFERTFGSREICMRSR